MVVPKTLANFLERKTRLYEQGATVRRIGQRHFNNLTDVILRLIMAVPPSLPRKNICHFALVSDFLRLLKASVQSIQV